MFDTLAPLATWQPRQPWMAAACANAAAPTRHPGAPAILDARS
jgi:hypothetical protein